MLEVCKMKKVKLACWQAGVKIINAMSSTCRKLMQNEKGKMKNVLLVKPCLAQIYADNNNSIKSILLKKIKLNFSIKNSLKDQIII